MPQNGWIDRLGVLLTGKSSAVVDWTEQHPNLDSVKLVLQENLSMQGISTRSDHLVRLATPYKARLRCGQTISPKFAALAVTRRC